MKAGRYCAVSRAGADGKLATLRVDPKHLASESSPTRHRRLVAGWRFFDRAHGAGIPSAGGS